MSNAKINKLSTIIKPGRREFMQTSALIGVGVWAGTNIAKESKSPNEKIQFGCIGVGGKGDSDTRDASRAGDIVGVCDIDGNRLEKAKRRYKKSQGFDDWRVMLDKIGKSLDAVTVSTPDHSHAVASATAMNMGLHCFTQKPLTHSIYEARRLGEIATKQKVKTMMGNQGTANNGVRKAAAIIQSGALGKISHVHVWTNRPIWAQGVDRPKTEPVPKGVKWDLFVGPAPFRPYGKGYQPFSWRGWWDFGTGALGDMACHIFNMPFMALNLRDPISVSAKHSGHNKETYPKWSIIDFEFPATKERQALKFTWYDGGKRPDLKLFNGMQKISHGGCLIVGDKAKIYTDDDYGAHIKILGDVEIPKVEYEKSPGHFKEWVQAMKGERDQATSNFAGYAGPLTETILLGNLSIWANKKVKWDAKKLIAKNADVEEIIKPKYRKGYSL